MLFNARKDADEKLIAKITEATGGSRYGIPWPLPNMKQVPERNFWGWRASNCFAAEVWCDQRKIEVAGETRWATIILYWVGHSNFIGGGFAVAVVRSEYGKEQVLYFEWMKCNHTFTGKNIGHCLNRYTCSKCGGHYDVDSSG